MQLNNIFERIVKDKNGTLVRVRFTVVDGRGQIVSTEPLVKNNQDICLPVFSEKPAFIDFVYKKVESVLSPYFSLDFLMSQPTRAPAFSI